jgi:hypothetical protein
MEMSTFFNFGTVFAIGIPLLLIGISAILFVVAASTFLRARGAKNWPHVQGTVIQAQIEHDQDDNGWHHRPLITYKYDVNEKSFQSNLLAFGAKREWFDDEKGRLKAEEMASHYLVGNPVDVRYNPSNPAQAVLVVRAASVGTMLIAAILLCVIGACLGFALNYFIQ